ncbi:hypothetical protein GCM10010207_85430 [Streptomyces atratus]|nr:hypothetical protein GCM10010207_85430 [Streptomyces atratus]
MGPQCANGRGRLGVASGPDGVFFAVYESLRAFGSFKAHFCAGHRWECVRD